MTKGNEPAFPTNYSNESDGPFVLPSEGMNLRDYMAAKAMQGMCAQQDTWGKNIEGISKMSYMMADAMIRARDEVK